MSNLPLHLRTARVADHKDHMARTPDWLQCAKTRYWEMRLLAAENTDTPDDIAERYWDFYTRYGTCTCWRCCAMPRSLF